MPHGRAAFRQVDVTRALRAARRLGLEITGFEVDPVSGKIVVRTGTAAPQQEETPQAALARWRAGRDRSRRA